MEHVVTDLREIPHHPANVPILRLRRFKSIYQHPFPDSNSFALAAKPTFPLKDGRTVYVVGYGVVILRRFGATSGWILFKCVDEKEGNVVAAVLARRHWV